MLASVVAVTVEASLVVGEAAMVVTDVLDSLVVVSLGAAIRTKTVDLLDSIKDTLQMFSCH